MEYSINKLSGMSGVSSRTLRYYDEMGILKPARINSSGYRIYGQKEANILQQILLYRELEFSLDEIKKLLTAPGFDIEQALKQHLISLNAKRERLDLIINNVQKSIMAFEGGLTMQDNEKFEGFKERLVDDNERQYGEEIRQKYGDQAVNESNDKVRSMTQEQYAEAEKLLNMFEGTLKAAFDTGDPSGEAAQKACDLHRQWLCIFYPLYSKEYHKGLGEMYVLDERFKANYEKIAPGCTEFLRDAINIYCG